MLAFSAVSSSTSTSVSDSQHSTSGSDGHSPSIIIVSPPHCQSDVTDDHTTNMAADSTVRSPPEVDRSPACAGDGWLTVTDGMVRTVEEHNSIVAKTSNANGICSNRRLSGTAGTKTSFLSRSVGLPRRLNAIVRDRIVFFTKKERSPSARS